MFYLAHKNKIFIIAVVLIKLELLDIYIDQNLKIPKEIKLLCSI